MKIFLQIDTREQMVPSATSKVEIVHVVISRWTHDDIVKPNYTIIDKSYVSISYISQTM